MSQRLIRVNELLKREIAEDLFRLQPPGFQIGTVTVTRVETAPNLRQARVYVSVFNEPGEQSTETAVRWLNRHHAEIQKMVCARVKLKYTPRLHFKADYSLEQGDRVLALLSEIEEESASEGEAADEPQL